MEWTGLNELRESFLSFFESKGHLRLKSASLVPLDDKSLLLINAGMAPLKKYFTGKPSRLTAGVFRAKNAYALPILSEWVKHPAMAHILKCSATFLSVIILRKRQ